MYRRGQVNYSKAQDRKEWKREEERTGEDRSNMIIQGRTGQEITGQDRRELGRTEQNRKGMDRITGRKGRKDVRVEGQSRKDRTRRQEGQDRNYRIKHSSTGQERTG